MLNYGINKNNDCFTAHDLDDVTQYDSRYLSANNHAACDAKMAMINDVLNDNDIA